MVFTDCLWPDFDEAALDRALTGSPGREAVWRREIRSGWVRCCCRASSLPWSCWPFCCLRSSQRPAAISRCHLGHDRCRRLGWARMNGCRNQAVALGTGVALAGVCAAMGFATWGRTDLSVLWWFGGGRLVAGRRCGSQIRPRGMAKGTRRAAMVARAVRPAGGLDGHGECQGSGRELPAVGDVHRVGRGRAAYWRSRIRQEEARADHQPRQSFEDGQRGPVGCCLGSGRRQLVRPSSAIHQRLGLVGLALALVADLAQRGGDLVSLWSSERQASGLPANCCRDTVGCWIGWMPCCRCCPAALALASL